MTSPIGLEVPAGPAGQVAKHSALLAVSAGLVGVLSYLCTLLMAHLLPPEQYTQYAAAQMLVGIVGIVAHALVPLPLAALVRRHAHRHRRAARGDGVRRARLGGRGRRRGPAHRWDHRGVRPGARRGGHGRGVAGALHGRPRTGLAAGGAAVHALRRGLDPRGRGPAGVQRGGGAARLGPGRGTARLRGRWPRAGRRAARDAARRRVAPARAARGVRWAETGDIALVQFVVSVLVGADVVLVALLGSGTPAEAGFQALATLAKGPVYVASGTVLVAFPLLRAGAPRVLADVLAPALHSFEALALTAAVVLATVPRSLVMLFLPDKYLGSTVLLPQLAAAGLGYGAMTVLATVLLALRMTRRTYVALVAATVLLGAGLGVGWALHGVNGMAVGAAVGALSATLVLAVLAAPALPHGTLGSTLRTALVAAVLLVVLLLTVHVPVLWLVCATVGGLLALRPDLVRRAVHRRSRR